MKLSGTGRILLWSGGSLWIGRSGEPTDFHSHHAIQIALSFPHGAMRFRCPDRDWNAYDAAIIAANQCHALDARDHHVAMIFAEPESHEGQALQQLCVEDGITSIAKGVIEQEIARLFDCYRNVVPDSGLVAAAQSVISGLATPIKVPGLTLDQRIKHTLALMRARIGDTILLTDMAAAACLSPDRFRHLFIEQTGIRFRPYVLWLRIEIALTAYAANHSLTEAAHAGGFADSAHFSRTFRRMFGIAPSSIRFE